jgi:hypothetical protein
MPKQERPDLPPGATTFTNDSFGMPPPRAMRDLALQGFEGDAEECVIGVVLDDDSKDMDMAEWGDGRVIGATHMAMAFCLGRASREFANRDHAPRLLSIHVRVTAED